MSEITRQIMKIAVAQICQNVGWNTAHTTPLDILNDIGQRYLQELCKATHDYSNQYGRTEPNLDDLGLAFTSLGVNLPDLADYINNVESVPFAYNVPSFPLSHPNNLCHPKPGSRELLQRPEHINEHLPPIHPEIDEEDILSAKSEVRMFNGDASSPPGKHPLLDATTFDEMPVSKKPRLGFDEDEGGRPMREVTSVFMTPSGFISPNREGRLPAPGIPVIQDTPPQSPISHPHHNPIKKIKESKKDKSGKKKDKNSHKKDSKKIKSSKKENKENSHLKLDKHISSSSLSKESSPSKPKKSKNKSPSKSGSSKKKKDKEKKKSKSSKEKSKNKVPKSPSAIPSASLSSPKSVKDLFNMQINPPLSHHPTHLPSSAKTQDSMQSTISPMRTISPPKHPSPIKPEVPLFKKEPATPPPKVEVVPEKPSLVKIEQPYSNYSNSNDSSEEFPEPRLVIDDSIETAERQEKEQRLAGLDECIDAVIQRAVGDAEKEEELSFKDDDEVNDTFITFGPHVKLEPKDVYDFTDTSSDSSRAPTPKSPEHSESPSKAPTPEPPPPPPPPEVEETPPKKTKEKKKSKKKTPKSSAASVLPPPPPSSLFIPSPKAIIKPVEKVRPHIYTDSEDSSSSDVPMSPKSAPSTPHLSSSPFSFNSSLSSRTLAHSFPTPPLFVTSESASHPTSIKTLAEKKAMPSPKPAPSELETKFDPLVKEDKKEKKQKVVKKDKGKKKTKTKPKEKEAKPKVVVEVEQEKPKVKEKAEKPKEKPEKPKPEKKAKAEKKKAKEPEEKPSPKKEVEEGAKLTLKWGSSSSKSGSKRSSPIAPAKSPTATPPPTPSKMVAATPPSLPPPPPAAPPIKAPPPVVTPSTSSGRGRSAGRGKGKKSVPSKTAVITETLGTSVDAEGNKIWICPACTHVDDGSPMIGCDECDDWYHWLCVNIIIPPKEEESWYCPRCLSKRTPPLQKRKKKRHRKDR